MPDVPDSTQLDIVQVKSDQLVTHVLGDEGEQTYIVEFEESVQDYSPPKIVEPLQPVAVSEGKKVIISIYLLHPQFLIYFISILVL